MIDKKIMEMKNEIIQAVRENVMIKSVLADQIGDMPFGEGIQRSLEHALNLAKELGFRTKNLDNMVGYAEYGEGDEMFAVLGHLDVVPEGDGWTYPPYGAEIHNGKIYGRGTLDDKGPMIGALFSLSAIKELNLPLKRRVRIIFGTNEESGSKGVKYYVERDEIPVAGFTPDAEYPIINAEKGILTCVLEKNFEKQNGKIKLDYILGGTAPNVVPDYAEAAIYGESINIKELMEACKEIEMVENLQIKLEKGDKDNYINIKVFGLSAHGSTPELGKNAISGLIHYLSLLELDGEVGKYMTFLHKNIGYETDGKGLCINLYDNVSGKLTFNLGTINGNANKIKMEINIRYPVTKKYNDLMAKLEEKMSPMNIKIEDIRHKAPLYVNPDEELIKKLQKVYKEKTSQDPTLLAIGGGTYAKAMKNIVAFGPVFPGEEDVIHQPDEHISIENLIKNVQIMAAAIYELAK